MVLPVNLIDGYGSGHKAKVNGEGEIGVVVHSHPPIDESVSAYPFSQFFTDDGTSAGSNDLRVNGATTPQEFYITAKSDVDVFIKTLSIRIGDQSSVLNKYGNLTALTNGVSWTFTTQKLGVVTIKDEIKTNLDFIRLGFLTAAVGDGSTAFRADASGAGADTYLPVIDLAQTFGFPWGLRLAKGSTDRISFTVNDDLSTGMDSHDIIGFGTQL